MRALTIRQPWADLIACGAKTVEVRTRPQSYRGPLLIHAAKDRDVRSPQVVAIAELADCRPFTADDLLAAQIQIAPPRGSWALCLADVRPLPGRIHWLGRQGLWVPEADLQELVADSLSPWGHAAAAAAEAAAMRLTWRDGRWRFHPPGDPYAEQRYVSSAGPGRTVAVCCWCEDDASRASRALVDATPALASADKEEEMEREKVALEREKVAAEAAAMGYELSRPNGVWRLTGKGSGFTGMETLVEVRDRLADEAARRAAVDAADRTNGAVDVPAVVVGKETEGAALADRLYGDDREYDRDRLTAEVRHHLGQGVLAMLEAGRRLLVLREHEQHGEWLPLLGRIGVGHETAKRLMRAARKFLDGPNRSLVTNLASVTAVYELAMLDDDDLQELREGGSIAGVTLDDIQRMSPSELRKTLRAERRERQDVERARQERLVDKERTIQRLQDDLEGARRRAWALKRPGAMPEDEEGADMLRQIVGCIFDARRLRTNCQAAMARLRGVAEQRAAQELEHAGEGPALPPIADRDSPAVATVAALKQQATELLDAIGAAQAVVEDALDVPFATERQALDDIQPWDRPIDPDAPDSE